jgi:hypothetical protein
VDRDVLIAIGVKMESRWDSAIHLELRSKFDRHLQSEHEGVVRLAESRILQ